MNNDKKKQFTTEWLEKRMANRLSPQSWQYWYMGSRNRDLLYIQQGTAPSTPVNELCLKYKIMTPRSFVSGMGIKFIDSNGEFRDYPNPKEKLGRELSVINSIDERIIYLESIIKHCKRELFDQPLHEQFDKLQNIAEKELKRVKNTSENKDDIQVGRPKDFDPKQIKSLYDKLKVQSEFQHGNGKPHKTNIREEIRNRLTRKEDGQTIKPSMKTIKRHT